MWDQSTGPVAFGVWVPSSGSYFCQLKYMLLHWAQSRAGLRDPPVVRGSQPGRGWFRPLSLSEVASGTAAVQGAASPWPGVHTGLMV